MNQHATTNSAPSRPAASRKRVLLLGGGFGGMNAARRLGRTLGKRQDIEVSSIEPAPSSSRSRSIGDSAHLTL